MTDSYESPFCTRYASKEMQKKVADAVGASVKEIIEGEQIILK